ncbi:MAG: hypothetical protein AMXMBFR82_50070 [Candidatus Hydrogenedentota bacterium]
MLNRQQAQTGLSLHRAPLLWFGSRNATRLDGPFQLPITQTWREMEQVREVVKNLEVAESADTNKEPPTAQTAVAQFQSRWYNPVAGKAYAPAYRAASTYFVAKPVELGP